MKYLFIALLITSQLDYADAPKKCTTITITFEDNETAMEEIKSMLLVNGFAIASQDGNNITTSKKGSYNHCYTINIVKGKAYFNCFFRNLYEYQAMKKGIIGDLRIKHFKIMIDFCNQFDQPKSFL